MKKYRLIALDMDGTLLNDAKVVSAKTQEWIYKLDQANIPVVLATGRGYQRVVHIQKELNIDQPMVLVNGAEAWEDQSTLLNRTFIPQEDIQMLQKIVLEHDASYWGYTTEGMLKGKEWTEDMLTWNWLKFGIKHPSLSVIKLMREKIMVVTDVALTSSNPHNIECAPKGVSKEVGLRKVCKYLDITMEEIVAVGDHFNDMDMIKAAGMGIAMGNATVEIKAVADATTETNENDGVVHVIQKYFFNM